MGLNYRYTNILHLLYRRLPFQMWHRMLHEEHNQSLVYIMSGITALFYQEHE